MVRRKIVKEEKKEQAPVWTHGQCGNAYGFCHPAHDGSPIFCKCKAHPECLKMRIGKACADFIPRTEPVPETVTERFTPLDESGKVVPLFEDPGNPRRVTRYVPAKEMRRRNVEENAERRVYGQE